MNKIKQSILAIVIGLVLSAGVSYAYSTWTSPTANPTEKNTDAPVNVGPTTQSKAGSLNLNGTIQALKGRFTTGSGETGNVLISADTDGTTKWGKMKIVTKIKLGKDDSDYYTDTKPWGESGKANKWNKGVIKCDSGYTRVGCTATCTGYIGDWDLTAVNNDGSDGTSDVDGGSSSDSEEGGCRLGTNDKCFGSNPVIRVRTVCAKITN